MRVAAALTLLLALTTLLSACRDSPSASSSPQPAASIRFVSGTTFDPFERSVTDGRVVIAYVRDRATPAEVRRLATRIATLPEVEQYSFMGKLEALAFFRGRYGDDATPAAVPLPEGFSLEVAPLPQGFWLLLGSADQASRVAAALADEPALKQKGGALSGVKPASEFYDWVRLETAPVG